MDQLARIECGGALAVLPVTEHGHEPAQFLGVGFETVALVTNATARAWPGQRSGTTIRPPCHLAYSPKRSTLPRRSRAS
jgi:hypothetical protein